MLCGILFVFILILGMHWTMAVNMCKNQASSGRDVSLMLVPGTDVSGCNCSVELTRTDDIGSVKPKIEFETVQFSGCKYKLVIPYNNTKSTISCFNINIVYHDINKSDEIKLYLEPTTNQDETTTFEVKITSRGPSNEGSLIILDCFLPTVRSTTKSVITTPNITDVPPTTSTTVTTQRSTTKSVQSQPTSTTEYITTTQRSTTKPVQPQPTSTTDYITTTQRTTTLTSITSTPDTLSSRQAYLTTSSTLSSKTGSTRQDDGDGDSCGDEVVIAGVIGGVIGGVIVGVSILIIMCIVKYRKRSKKSSSEIYSTPQHNLPESQYTDLQIIQYNNENN